MNGPFLKRPGTPFLQYVFFNMKSLAKKFAILSSIFTINKRFTNLSGFQSGNFLTAIFSLGDVSSVVRLICDVLNGV